MKKTHKKVLGFLGLALVATMTVFAAVLPNPEALAASSTSMTDTIVVRVLAGTPDVNINKPSSGSIFVGSMQTITFDYSNTNDVLVTMEKEIPGGTPQIYGDLFEAHPNQAPGSDSVVIDLSGPLYGYGVYTVHIRGASGSIVDEDSATFSYLPVTASVEEDDTGKVEAILRYDDDNEDLDHFVINVYDENGHIVEALSPITVDRPTKEVVLPFADKKVPAGKYTVAVLAYNVDGEVIYSAYETLFVYDPVRVPNTGGFFRALNISQSDYLITGLIIFFTAGLAGVWFIAKGRRTSKK